MRALALGALLLVGCGDLLPSSPCSWCYMRQLQCESKVVTVDGKQMVKYACLVRDEIGMKPLDADGGLPGQ